MEALRALPGPGGSRRPRAGRGVSPAHPRWRRPAARVVAPAPGLAPPAGPLTGRGGRSTTSGACCGQCTSCAQRTPSDVVGWERRYVDPWPREECYLLPGTGENYTSEADMKTRKAGGSHINHGFSYSYNKLNLSPQQHMCLYTESPNVNYEEP